MTVREYTLHFIEKARFAEYFVPIEETKVERYVWGLRGSLRELVSTLNPTTFRTTIDDTELTEREKDR